MIYTGIYRGDNIKDSETYYKLEKNVSKFEKFRKNADRTIIASIAGIFMMVIFSFAIGYHIINLSDIYDNLRYYFSAAAQCLAALITIILVIFNIFISRIPSYEPIFKSTNDKILKKYYEVVKTQKLIIETSFTILFLLLSTIFIYDNAYLYPLFIMSVGFLTYIIFEMAFFMSNTVIGAGKSKFFDDAYKIIETNLHYSELMIIYDNVKEYMENSPAGDMYVYRELVIDKPYIEKIIPHITKAFGEALNDKKFVGDALYYPRFVEIIQFLQKQPEDSNLIDSLVFDSISSNFLKHTRMCIEIDADKYTYYVLDILVNSIDLFSHSIDLRSFEIYMNQYKKCFMTSYSINHPTIRSQSLETLQDLSNRIALKNMHWYDHFISMLNSLSIDKDVKKSVYSATLQLLHETYGKAESDTMLRKSMRAQGMTFPMTIKEYYQYIQHIKEQ